MSNRNFTRNECLQDLYRLQEEFPNRTLSRDFYRKEGTIPEPQWLSHFGTFAEFKKAAGLDFSRGQQSILRNIATHESHDKFKQFQENEIKPWVGKFKKPIDQSRFKTVLVCADLHDRQLDPFTWGVFLDVAKRVQPDVICLGGDIFDEAEFSKYDVDPRKLNLKESFDFVKNNIFAPLRKTCPDSQIDMVIGNHDWRILKLLADKTPYLPTLLHDIMGLTLADLFGLPKYKINLVCRTDLDGFTPAATRDQIKQNFAVYYDCLVVDHHGNDGFGMSGCNGHRHKCGMKSGANLTRGPVHWVEMGCMAKIDFDYQERLNKSHQSFVLWHIDRETKQAVPEHIIFSDEHVCALGRYYYRKDFK